MEILLSRSKIFFFKRKREDSIYQDPPLLLVKIPPRIKTIEWEKMK